MSISDSNSTNVTIIGTDDIDIINGTDENEEVYAKGGDDTLKLGGGNDIVYAGDGDDGIHGGLGDDIIIPGEGNDSSNGNEGDDIFIFEKGFGIDSIWDKEGLSTIKFGEGISLSDLRLSRAQVSDTLLDGKYILKDLTVLQISIPETGDTLNLNQFFNGDFYSGDSYYGENYKLEFADGTTVTGNELIKQYGDILGDDRDNHLDSLNVSETIRMGDGNDIVESRKGSDNIYGEEGNDFLYAYSRVLDMNHLETDSNLLDGGSGHDTLHGAYGNDILVGGAGNDRMYGSSGNDTFVFGQGFGKDTITDVSGNTVIRFEEGISLSDIQFFTGFRSSYKSINYKDLSSANNLVISLVGTDNVIQVNEFFKNNNGLKYRLEFEDGTIYTGQDLFDGKPTGAPIIGTENADIIYGTDWNDEVHALGGNDQIILGSGNDIAYGGDGDDSISGGLGDDIIIGGTGDDRLSGNEGNDTYTFNKGFGSDSLLDKEGHTIIKFGEGITLNSLKFKRGYVTDKVFEGGYTLDGFNILEISLPETGDTLQLHDFFHGDFYVSDSYYGENYKFEFSDGTIVAGNEIIAQYGDILGDDRDNFLDSVAASETIRMGAGNDIVEAKSGSDNIYGEEGNDTLYAYSRLPNTSHLEADSNLLDGGLGHDSLHGAHGNDILIGGTGSDKMYGSAGNDTYVFGQGFGQDTITDLEGNTVIRFKEGISLSDLEFNQGSIDSNGTLTNESILYIKQQGTENQITIKDFFTEGDTRGKIIGDNYTVELSDGTALKISDILNGSIILGTDLQDDIIGTDSSNIIYGFDGNDTIKVGKTLNSSNFAQSKESNTVFAGEGDDYIYGGAGDDYIYGGAGNDIITAYEGDDYIEGGSGDDLLLSYKGSNTFYFERGFGNDTLRNHYGENKVKFGDGILESDIEFLSYPNLPAENPEFQSSDNRYHLGVKLKGTEDVIVIQNFFKEFSFTNGLVGNLFKFEFADGKIISGQDLLSVMPSIIIGTDNSETIRGDSSDNIIDGGNGSDRIYGGLGDDLLISGSGSDVLYGEDGDDTLIISDEGNLWGGSGNDTFVLEEGISRVGIVDGDGLSTIKLWSGVTWSDLEFVRGKLRASPNDQGQYENYIQNYMFVKIKGTASMFHIADFFQKDETGNYNGLKYNLELSDGTVISGEEIINSGNITVEGDDTKNKITGIDSAAIFNGYGGNDIIEGSAYADIIDGGLGYDKIYANAGNDIIILSSGNDYVEGGEGDDTYVYKANSNTGQAKILDNTGISTIKFEEGISLSDLEFFKGDVSDWATVEYDNLDSITYLQIKFKNSTDVIKINDFFIKTESGFIGNNYKLEFSDGTVYTGQDIFDGKVIGSSTQGTNGDDEINGTSGNDEIYGNDGSDYIFAGEGDDYIEGGNGRDMIRGKGGNDTIIGGYDGDWLYGGNGDDIVYAGTIDGLDNSGNKLQGDLGNDILYGANFDDLLKGGKGDDTLFGNEGNDKYLFLGDFGEDIMTDTEGLNTLVIESDVNDLWFSKGDNTLQINKLGTDEQIIITDLDQSTNLITTKDGFVLDNANLDSLINAMAQFNPQDGITETFNPTIDQQTSDLIAASWSKN